MSKGIYGYKDLETNDIVYIGKDSNISKNKRHNSHKAPSCYDVQPFNRILQNNLHRYKYSPIYICPPYLDDKDLNGLEIQYIEAIKPKFNYTKGGDGNPYWLGKHFSETHKQKIGEGNRGKFVSDETKQKLSKALKGKKLSEETKRKISESHKKDYPTLVKQGINNGKQQYGICFRGKILKRSVYREKLERLLEEMVGDYN